MRVVRCRKSPRAKTCAATYGASGTTTCQRPSSSVGQRAKAGGSWCQVSTSASPIGSPAPSSTRPEIRTPPGAAAGPDVELVGQRPVLVRALHAERADHALARLRVAHRVEDRVELEQRVR